LSKVTKSETGNRNVMPWPPPWRSLWRCNSAVCGPVYIQFGRLMQSVMVMVMRRSRRSKSKRKVEFQHGRRSFQETGSSNISTEIWYASRFW